MISVAVIVVVLAAMASFGSWQFAHLAGTRPRASRTALILCGLSFAVAVVLLAMMATTSWLRPLAQIEDLSAPMLAPAVQTAAKTPEITEPAVTPVDTGVDRITTKEVATALKGAQAAMSTRDWKTALTLIEQARAVRHRTAFEDFQIAEFLMYVQIQLRNFRQAALALEQVLRWQRLNPERRLELLRTGAQLNFQVANYLQAIDLAQQYLAKQPEDAALRALLAQALRRIGRHAEAAREIDAAIEANVALGLEVPADWLELRSASRSGDARNRGEDRQTSQQNHPEESPEPPAVAVAGSGAANPLLKDWPATDCVTSARNSANASGRQFIDNNCERLVAVVFAWCQRAHPACSANLLTSQGWRYEPAGILMTSATQRPSQLRLGGEKGPLVAATYAFAQPNDQRRHVRYLACYVTAPAVLSLIAAGNNSGTPDVQRRRLAIALSDDECYSRVAELSRAGQREGKSPDALIRDGI